MPQDRWRSVILNRVPLAATIGVSMVNGSEFSPLFDAASFFIYSFSKGLPIAGAAFNYLTSVALFLLTLLLAGVPAALYERWRGLKNSTPRSLMIWLLAAVLLTLPTLTRLLNREL